MPANPKSADVPKLAYRIAEVVVATGLGKTFIRDEINRGNLKARKQGGATVVLASDLNAYLEALPVLKVADPCSKSEARPPKRPRGRGDAAGFCGA